MKMGTVESRARRSRQAERRPALLAALRAADRPLGVEEVAAAIGVAVPTARFHLSMLVSSGQVERVARRSGTAGRPSWGYAASPEPRPGGSEPGAYLDLARALASQLDGVAGASVAAREAGRRWADGAPGTTAERASSPAEAVASLARTLDGLGFAPEPDLAAREVVLHACPFEAVARDHRAVVCAVHLGLVERTAAAIGGGIEVDGLEPFRTEAPLTCAVRLRLPS
jgi:predicted ArsR family transcriptional regulator